jgi:hypothetical protein
MSRRNVRNSRHRSAPRLCPIGQNPHIPLHPDPNLPGPSLPGPHRREPSLRVLSPNATRKRAPRRNAARLRKTNGSRRRNVPTSAGMSP